MTLGGSLFPGALGAMLIEILPFMRGVASDIRDALGDSNPSVVPTVMVANALSSFLIGIIFIAIGCLGLGLLFPSDCSHGAIGGIGVSLFILGLELPLPKGQALTTSNAGSVLFGHDHVGLLMASVVPIFFLCFSVRSTFLSRLTSGAVEHPYYVPIYILIIGILFWVIVGGLGLSKLGGLSALAEKGWLFSTGDGPTSTKCQILVESLNYWSLFDFRLVKLSALRHTVVNFVLLVVIGVLNLPLYVPALALALNVPYSMNHELIGQGAANILAGACGSVPNILQLSYSVFFTRAGGKRIEAVVVIILTAVLYIVSSKFIRYIPTVLALGLVLFLGIELALEAVWESAKYLVWSEWLVVMATLLACTFLGFAPGVGVGICAAFVVYTGWGCFDLRATKQDFPDDRTTSVQRRYHRLLYPGLEPFSEWTTQYSKLPTLAPLFEEDGILQSSEMQEKTGDRVKTEIALDIKVVRLDGYIFFGVIPSIESTITSPSSKENSQKYTIIDMELAYRVETAAARLIRTKARETPRTTLVVCGFNQGSGVAADLKRSGVGLCFMSDASIRRFPSLEAIPTFKDCSTAAEWCRFDRMHRNSQPIDGLAEVNSSEEECATVSSKFLTMFRSNALEPQFAPTSPPTKIRVLRPTSGRIPRPTPGTNTIHVFCLVYGALRFGSSEKSNDKNSAVAYSRPMPARYNRESLLGSFTTTGRYAASLAAPWIGRLGLGNAESQAAANANGSETELESEISDKTGRAMPGDVIFIPLPTSTSSSEKTPTVCDIKPPVADPRFRLRIWPESCAAVIDKDFGSSDDTVLRGEGANNASPDPCWIVEIVSPAASLSQESPENACQNAVHRAFHQLETGYWNS